MRKCQGVDRRVEHYWLDKAYATGSMDDLIQILETPMDGNFPEQFDILFHNLTKSGFDKTVVHIWTHSVVHTRTHYGVQEGRKVGKAVGKNV